MEESKKTTKKVVKKVDPQVETILDRFMAGLNINQIASQMGLHSQYVKKVIDEKL